MSYIFNTSKAVSIDLSSFNTSKVTNMTYAFGNVQSVSLDLSDFDTSNVINMRNMFYNCKTKSLDLSNFDTSRVTDMYQMFYFSNATTLDLSSFNTSKVIDMGYMFCHSQAETLNLSSFNTSKVTNMSYMFDNSKVKSLDLSKFNTSKVTYMSDMFSESSATFINVSSFNTSNVTNMRNMFYYSQVTNLDLNNFDTSNVTIMSSMFGGTKLISLDLSSFDTSKVTSMWGMFKGATNLKTIYVGDKFITDKVTSSTDMFNGCTKLVGGSGTKYSSSHTDKTYARIDGGTSSPGYFTDIEDKNISDPVSFSSDSWATIVNAVRNNNISKYNIGDTKTIDMGSYGTHTLRIANTSTPSECSTSGFSQTACGFVIEFMDTVTTHIMNPSGTYNNINYSYGYNIGGWPNTEARTFINNDIYNSIPNDLRKHIIDTLVVSSHGKDDTANFTSTDKLYLLSPKEVYDNYNDSADSARSLTRQLDYYKNIGVNDDDYSAASKKNGSSAIWWWMRSATNSYNYNFACVGVSGQPYNCNASTTRSIIPAFRIG